MCVCVGEVVSVVRVSLMSRCVREFGLNIGMLSVLMDTCKGPFVHKYKLE